MRKLMLGTAMILPLMMGPAFAQDTATTPAPAEPATDATTAPMGADTAAEVPAGENTEAAADSAAAADVAASGKVEQQQAENELRIDWITDATVNSPDGEAIGEINDVIVDAEAGTMKAAVIGVGGFLGIGEKQIAVPWDQLEINYDAQQITSDLTQEEAEAAPEYVFREQEAAPDAMGTEGAAGVKVTKITEDNTPGRRVHNPEHPLADAQGYVTHSNVNAVDEMVNMISASRSYQNNVEVMNTAKSLLLKTLQLGQ